MAERDQPAGPPALPAVIAATLALQALSGLLFLALPVLAPAYGGAGLDAGAVGLYVSLVFAAAMPASLATGALARRLGALRLLQLATLAAAAGLGLLLTGHPALLPAAALLVGFGYGPITPGTSVILNRVVPESRRNLVFSVNQAGVALGGLAAGAMLPALATRLSDGHALGAAIALALLAALLVQPLRGRLDVPAAPSAASPVEGLKTALAAVLVRAGTRRLALLAFAFGTLQVCVFAYAVTFQVREIGLSLIEAGGLFALMQAASIAFRVIWGQLADGLRAPRTILAAIGLGGAGAMAALALLAPGWPGSAQAAVWVAVGATAGAWNGLLFAEAARADADGGGSAASGIAFCTFAGVLLGPLLFGALLQASGGYRLAFITVGLLALAAALNLVRRPGATPD